MSLDPGVRLGPYEIQSRVGAGGMGEVYKARDTRLNRTVAVKVLPTHLAADGETRERFEREARAISSLSHPHICQLYDVGSQDGTDFLVMEYLDGQTLADRIARGPVPLDQALPIARQIASALEAAHDSGIIHRDLKPANIHIGADGSIKVLDFGLAKMQARGGSELSDASTLMATSPGVVMGTSAYMSPEQASGGTVDRATDTWAFGCVLFEMLSGRRVFEGKTTSETIVQVIRSDPQWDLLPADTPDGVRRLLRRTLQKDGKLRLRDMRDARLDLDEPRTPTSNAGPAHGRGFGKRERWLWASALTALTLAAAAIAFWPRPIAPPPPESRFEINTPPSRNQGLAVSPDGRRIVYIASAEGQQAQLWLRSFESSVARPLAGTDRAWSPFWSPDGKSIGFFADNRVKRLDIDGGSLRSLAPGVVPRGGSWNRDGVIIFSNSPGGAIIRVSADGGEATPATRVKEPEQRGHGYPVFLPDGRHFLFYVTGNAEVRGIHLGQLDNLDDRRLLGSDGPAVYLSSGHLLFVRAGKLLAQPFDPNGLTLSGDPVPVVESFPPGTSFSASAAGPIAYRSASPGRSQRQLVWFDRTGKEQKRVVYADTAAIGPALSYDGQRIAVYSDRDSNMDIWSYNVSTTIWDRITVNPGDDVYPLWSRDGTSIVSASVNKSGGTLDLYRTRVGQPGSELLLATKIGKFPTDWSFDGRFLLFDIPDPKGGTDIGLLTLGDDGTRTASVFLATDFSEGMGQFSPDGAWVAYQSDQSTRVEVYLRPFPGSGESTRVSIDGGGQVRWHPNGHELFFIATDGSLMSAPLQFSADNRTVEVRKPTRLFATDVGAAPLTFRQQYMVGRDGNTFIMNSAFGEGNVSPITIILNLATGRR